MCICCRQGRAGGGSCGQERVFDVRTDYMRVSARPCPSEAARPCANHVPRGGFEGGSSAAVQAEALGPSGNAPWSVRFLPAWAGFAVGTARQRIHGVARHRRFLRASSRVEASGANATAQR